MNRSKIIKTSALLLCAWTGFYTILMTDINNITWYFWVGVAAWIGFVSIFLCAMYSNIKKIDGRKIFRVLTFLITTLLPVAWSEFMIYAYWFIGLKGTAAVYVQTMYDWAANDIRSRFSGCLIVTGIIYAAIFLLWSFYGIEQKHRVKNKEKSA